jgi:hypothetical protein
VPLESFSRRALGRALLARQLLLERRDCSVEQVLTRVGGLQAQEPRPPFLALWNRIAGFANQDLITAALRRSAVRATLHRGTIHLLDSTDYPVWRTALSGELAALPRGLGPAARAVDVPAVRAAAQQLFQGRRLRFGELRPLLAERFPDVDPHILGVYARMTVPLVLPPTDNVWGWAADPAFARADDWIAMPDIDPAVARDQLVLAHLAAFGPARAADVAAWSGMRSVQVVLDRLAAQLVRFSDESGRVLYDLPDAPRPTEEVPAPPRLLGDWDTVLLGHAEHSRVVDAEVRRRLMTSNGRLRPCLMVDGRVVGGWSVEQSGSTALLSLEPYVPVPRAGLTSAAGEAADLLSWLSPGTTGHDVQIVKHP